MAKNDVYLGIAGSETLMTSIGRTVSVSDIELSRQERTASGKLVKDIITVKKKITLSYSYITGTDLDIFLDLYDLKTTLSCKIYDALLSTLKTYSVLISPIDYERVLIEDSGLFSGVQIVLEEV